MFRRYVDLTNYLRLADLPGRNGISINIICMYVSTYKPAGGNPPMYGENSLKIHCLGLKI